MRWFFTRWLYDRLSRRHKDERVTELLNYNKHKVEEVRQLRDMLGRCLTQFRYYERQHRNKGTPEALAKAEVNERFADDIWNTLDTRI